MCNDQKEKSSKRKDLVEGMFVGSWVLVEIGKAIISFFTFQILKKWWDRYKKKDE